MTLDFRKPMYLNSIDGYNVGVAMIDEIEHRLGEHPIIHGHLIDRTRVNYPKTRHPIDKIKKVVFNNPATIVIWEDGTKTVVKCQPNDEYNAETGLLMCIAKKHFGNTGNFNEVFKKWIPDYKAPAEDPKPRNRYLYSNFLFINERLGVPGEPTPYIDSEGNSLFVGDVVRVSRDGETVNESSFVCRKKEKPFVMGILDRCDEKNGKIDAFTVTRIKKYTDVKVGEKHDFVTLCEE